MATDWGLKLCFVIMKKKSKNCHTSYKTETNIPSDSKSCFNFCPIYGILYKEECYCTTMFGIKLKLNMPVFTM